LRHPLITAVVIMFTASCISFSQVKIAFVDSEIIIKQLPEAQEVQKKLEEIQKQYYDTINTKEAEIKTKAEEFKTKYDDAQKQVQSGKLKPDEISALENEISTMQSNIQKMDSDLTDYKQSANQSFANTQVTLFKPVKDKITKVIEQVAKELKYNIVLDKASDSLIYGDKDLDITFKVLDKMK
jgi:outer membrane protein